MQKLILRAYPIVAVLCDVLFIYTLGKELVSDIKNHRKNTTTTKDATPEPEPVTT